MTSAHLSFNLIEEPWIPVESLSGEVKHVGLLEALSGAHRLRRVYDPNPLVSLSLLRMLIVIQDRSTGAPASIDEWWRKYLVGHVDTNRLDAYFAEYRDRFDLFHPKRPFAQADAEVVMPQSARKSVNYLVIDKTSSGYPVWNEHSFDANGIGLHPAKAARALLTTQNYALGTFQGFKDGPMVGGYSVSLEGKTLFETILLNTPVDQRISADESGDAPYWESGQTILQEDLVPRGLTDYLTWRSRSIRLIPDESGNVGAIDYRPGQKCVFAQGQTDPYRRYEVGKDEGLKARKFDKARALWRDAHALLEETQPFDLSTGAYGAGCKILFHLGDVIREKPSEVSVSPLITVVGLDNKSARPNFIRQEQLPISEKVMASPNLRDAVESAVDAAEQVGSSLRIAADTWARFILQPDWPVIGKPREPQNVPQPSKRDRDELVFSVAMLNRYWSVLPGRFVQFLNELSSDPHDAGPLNRWFAFVEHTAKSAFEYGAHSYVGNRASAKATVLAGNRLRSKLNKLRPLFYLEEVEA